MDQHGIMENKNIPENGGLVEADTLPEMVPLKRDLQRDDDFNDEKANDQEIDIFTRCARKLRMTPKKAVIYLAVSWAIMVVLFIIVIFMAAFWPKSDGVEVFTSAECHRVAGVILSSMNRSAQPCEEFWSFSCGGWTVQNPIPTHRGDWSGVLVEEDGIKHKIRTLINTVELKEETNSVDYKVKRFYESCMAVQYIEVDKDKFLKKIFNELGGWNALKTFRMDEFDFPRVLRKIHAEYRASPFFQIEVVRDPFTSGKSVIQITPSGLSLPGKSYYSSTEANEISTAFKSYVKEVMQLLGSPSFDAASYASAIYNYEARIAEAMPFNSTSANFTRLRVDELNGLSSTVFWPDLLKAIFPQGHVRDDTEVVVTSLDYLRAVSEIISTTEKTVLNNYVMWTLTHQYLPYLSKHFVFAREVFRRQVVGAKTTTPRWEFCIDETIKIFAPVIGAQLAGGADRRAEKVDKATALFDSLKSTVKDRISESARFDESLRTWATEKLRSMTLSASTPTDRKFLIDLYHPLGVQHNEFFSNVVQGVQFKLQLQQRQLTGNDDHFKSLFEMNYSPVLNTVNFPEAEFQSDRLLVEEEQSALLYGTLGVQIAEAIASAFGPKLGLYSSGVLMNSSDPKYEDSLALLEQKRTCLQSFFTNIKLDDADYIAQTSLDTVVHLAGIEIALDSLNSMSYTSLPSLNYDQSGLFFLVYGQSQCSSTTLAFHDLEHSVFQRLTAEHRVRGLLRQLGLFTDAFKCPKTSEMYADFRCGRVL